MTAGCTASRVTRLSLLQLYCNFPRSIVPADYTFHLSRRHFTIALPPLALSLLFLSLACTPRCRHLA